MTANEPVDRDRISKELVGHVQKDGGGIRVDRTTKFGNPFRLQKDGGEYTREESVEEYESWLVERVQNNPEFRVDVEELAGEPLDCWCQERGEVGPACHAEILATHALYLANQG